ERNESDWRRGLTHREEPDPDPWLQDREDEAEDRPYGRRHHSSDPDGGNDIPALPPPDGARWRAALAVGCQAVAWCLRRKDSRCRPLLALGIGLGALLACLANSDSTVADVIGPAVGLASLADVV